MAGVKSVIDGTLTDVTRNGCSDIAEAVPTVTAMAPVVAPAGTAATISFAVADTTLAAVALNDTRFWPRDALKPVPKIWIAAPTGPLGGVNVMMESCSEF
jgi:hypothetical protein